MTKETEWTKGPLTLILDDERPHNLKICETASGRDILPTQRFCYLSEMITAKDCIEGKGFDPHDKLEDFRKSNAVKLNVEQLANFNLWVSAPELYEALNALILRPNGIAEQAQAKTAISKAIGEKT